MMKMAVIEIFLDTGKNGLEKGCRGVIYDGDFYNIDRNKWVKIGGVKYKASNLVD